jgi:hypothetical protein
MNGRAARTKFGTKRRIKMYVYIQSEPGLWTVGFYSPDGEWHPESDFSNALDARERVHYLNGGA